MNTRSKLIALVISIAGVIPAATIASGVTEAATPTCKDSNGTDPGGSVYLDYRTTTFVCNVVPPQRLHLTHTPNAAACADAGGRYTPASHICWDVDY